MSGWLSGKASIYISILRKISVANKYGKLHYSTHAYPSPELTADEWELIYRLVGNPNAETPSATYYLWRNYASRASIPSVQIVPITKEFIDQPYVGQMRKIIRECYTRRSFNPIGTNNFLAFDPQIFDIILKELKAVDDYYKIDSNNYKIRTIDRVEKCYAPEGNLTIDFEEQEANLKKYIQNVKDESYYLYLDPKTMQPLVGNLNGTFNIYPPTRVLRAGTLYYKWSRTVQRTLSDTDYLGENLVISADSFPEEFKIVGETYIRGKQPQKDSRYQFIINRAQLSPETNINLSATGEPSTFSMDINVLPTPNGTLFELRRFDTIEDKETGGAKIIAQSDSNTRTYTSIKIPTYEDIVVEEE